MIVQLFWLDGHCSDQEIMVEGPHEVIVLHNGGINVYFHLDAGRYVQCKSVVFA